MAEEGRERFMSPPKSKKRRRDASATKWKERAASEGRSYKEEEEPWRAFSAPCLPHRANYLRLVRSSGNSIGSTGGWSAICSSSG